MNANLDDSRKLYVLFLAMWIPCCWSRNSWTHNLSSSVCSIAIYVIGRSGGGGCPPPHLFLDQTDQFIWRAGLPLISGSGSGTDSNMYVFLCFLLQVRERLEALSVCSIVRYNDARQLITLSPRSAGCCPQGSNITCVNTLIWTFLLVNIRGFLWGQIPDEPPVVWHLTSISSCTKYIFFSWKIDLTLILLT